MLNLRMQDVECLLSIFVALLNSRFSNMSMKQTNKLQRQKVLHTSDLHCVALPNLCLFTLSMNHVVGNSTVVCVEDNQFWGFPLVSHTECGELPVTDSVNHRYLGFHASSRLQSSGCSGSFQNLRKIRMMLTRGTHLLMWEIYFTFTLLLHLPTI